MTCYTIDASSACRHILCPPSVASSSLESVGMLYPRLEQPILCDVIATVSSNVYLQLHHKFWNLSKHGERLDEATEVTWVLSLALS